MANNNVKIGVDIETRGAQQNTESLKESTKSLKQEYRELTEAIAKANLEGKNNTAEYQNMIKKAGELRDAMSDANQAINAAASDTSNLDAVLGAASAATGGFGAATAIMEIMGANTDDVSKAQKRLQQAIALVNSVQAISNALNKDSALMVKLNAVAHSLLTKQMNATAIATSAASGALKLFKAALVSTGVGALVVGLGFLVEKFTSLSGSASSAISSIDTFDANTSEKIKDLQRQYELLEKKGDALAQAQLKVTHATEDANKAVADLKGFKERKKDYENTIDLVKQYNEASKDFLWVPNFNTVKRASDEMKNLGEQIRNLGLISLPTVGGFSDKAINELENSVDEYAKKIKDGEIKILETRNKAKQAQNELDEVEAKERDKNIQKRKEAIAKQIEQAKQFARNIRQIADETRESIRRQQELDIEGTDPNSQLYWSKRLTYAQKWYDEDKALEDERYKNQSASIKELGLTQEQVDNLHKAKVRELELRYGIMFNEIKQGYDDYKKNLDETSELQKKQQIRDFYERELINQQNILEAYQGSIKKELELKEDQLYWEKQLELEAAEETGADKMLIEQKYERLQQQLRIESMNQYLDIAQSTMDSISTIMNSFFPKNKQIQIATTIASTIANAAQAFGSTYAQAPGGVIAKAAQAGLASAAVLAQGYAAVREIKGVTKDTQSFGGGTTTSVSEGGRNVSDTFITSRFSNINNGRIETVLVVQDVEAAQMKANRVKVNSSI